MKRKLSAFLLLPFIVNNTYADKKLNQNVAVTKNDNIIENKNIDSNFKENQKKKKTIF